MITIQELGEQALLAQLQRVSPPDLTGDDAAVLPFPPPDSLVISTDMLVEGVHFSEQTTPGFEVGWRAAAANLSDLAAMGAMPVGITIALGLPGTTPLEWVLNVYEGITACLQPWRSPILGGDVCQSPVRTISITVLGKVPPAQTIYRHGAQAGDWIIATGIHGAARAGLECLLQPDLAKPLDPDYRQTWQIAHQRPFPRLDLVASLQALNTRITGMDSSDGLADAVLQICRASQVGAELWTEQLPIPDGLGGWVGQSTAIAWTLYGGEDFELILILPEKAAQSWLQRVRNSLDLPKNHAPRPIGIITVNPDVCLLFPDQNRQQLDIRQGFQHF
ncbi:MAG: thiamine-phosphate kinase [Synechocystis sp.]